MERTSVLEFEDYPGEAITVRLSPISLEVYGEIFLGFEAAAKFARPAEIGKLCDAFAPALVSWTFPAPADRKGMDTLDPNLLLAIAGSWIQEVRLAPLPLRVKSSGTAPSTGDSAPSPAAEA